MITWSCPHTAWQLSLIHLNWTSDQRLPLPRLQEAHTLFLCFFWVVLMVTSSVSEHMKQFPRGWLPIRVCHILSWCIWVGWGPTVIGTALIVLIPGTPQGSHYSPNNRISGGLVWTGRGVGRFMPLWFRAGPTLQCQFGHVLITLCRAVFSSNLDLLRVNMVHLLHWSLSMLLEEWSHFFTSVPLQEVGQVHGQ